MTNGSRRTSDDRFELLSRGLLRWVLGFGFLSLHVGVFLVTAVGMLLWNFARTPSDVWVDRPLRQWGLVVVFHTTAVAAGWAVWKLMRLGVESAAPARPATSRRSTPPTGSTVVPAGSVPPPAAPTVIESAAAGGRRWLGGGATAPGSIAVANGHTHPSVNGSNGHHEPVSASGTKITEWGMLFVRRTRTMFSSPRAQGTAVPPILPIQPNGSNGHVDHQGGTSGEATVPVEPASSWPVEMTPFSGEHDGWPMPDLSGFQTPNAHHTGHNSQNGYNGHVTDLAASASAPNDAWYVEDVTLRRAERVDDPAAEDARWSWVESASTSWMSRPERDDLPTDLPEPPVDDNATTQP